MSRYQQKEWGIRTVHVWRIPVSVSNTRGSLVIRGRPEHRGLQVTITKGA